MEELKGFIRNIPDFPKPGIQFKDVTTLFQDPKGLKMSLDALVDYYKDYDIDMIAGVESRGFILGAALADRMGKGFVTVRKKGKLPWKTVSQSYELEYGTDELEVHIDACEKGQKILVVDDLLATGGTLEAACLLLEKIGAEVMGTTCIIELVGLNGVDKLKKWPFHALIDFEEVED